MTGKDFAYLRGILKKTQKEMARLIGFSVKAVRSYEQGWRSVPVHVERQVFFLMSRKFHKGQTVKNCWDMNDCHDDQRKRCPAWEFNAGEYCWFINGTICCGEEKKNWEEKMQTCRECKVLKTQIPISLTKTNEDS